MYQRRMVSARPFIKLKPIVLFYMQQNLDRELIGVRMSRKKAAREQHKFDNVDLSGQQIISAMIIPIHVSSDFPYCTLAKYRQVRRLPFVCWQNRIEGHNGFWCIPPKEHFARGGLLLLLRRGAVVVSIFRRQGRCWAGI